MMRTAIVATVMGAIVGSLAGGVVVSNAQQSSTSIVSIDNFLFMPQALTVKAGTMVIWTNKDQIPHGIAAANNAFARSKIMNAGDSYSFTFQTPGTYEYLCYIHPQMKGKIVVRAETGGNAAQ